MDRIDETTAPATLVQGRAYKLAADEGTALWFTNALVLVKAGGPETKQRLTISGDSASGWLRATDAPASG